MAESYSSDPERSRVWSLKTDLDLGWGRAGRRWTSGFLSWAPDSWDLRLGFWRGRGWLLHLEGERIPSAGIQMFGVA